MAKKTAILTCPDCGTVIEMEYGFMKKTRDCPKCHRLIDIRKDAAYTILCQHCGNEVSYDARKGLGQLCPVCHNPLQSKMEQKKFDAIPCPICRVINQVPVGSEKFTCTACRRVFDAQVAGGKKKAENADQAYVIQAPDARDFLIWQHPLDRFPYASRIIVPDGLTALLCRNGICSAPTQPGSYLLQDSMLSAEEQLELAVEDQDQQIVVKIYYVNNYIGKQIKWGEPKTQIISADGKTKGTLSTVGSVSVRVCNSQFLVRFLNYQQGSEDDLLWIRPSQDPSNPQRVEASKLMNEIRIRTFDGVNLAAQDMANGRGWDLNDLKRYRYEIEGEAKTYVSDKLRDIGLDVVSLSITWIEFEESAESLEKKKEDKQREDVEKAIRIAAEKLNMWESAPLPVHQKGDSTLSADLLLEGRFKLRINNQSAFYANSQVVDWADRGAGETEILRSYSEQVSELVKNVFADVLQPMIDDTGADVAELHRYFGFLRKSIQSYLDRCFADYGLQVDQFTLSQKMLRKSPTLEKFTSFASHKTETEIEQQAREYGRRIEERNAADSGRHGTAMNHIGNEARVATAADDADTVKQLGNIDIDKDRHLAGVDAQRQQLQMDAFARKVDLERAMEEKQRELDRLRQSWQEADEDELEARGFIKARENLSRTAEIDELADDLRKNAKLRSVEEMRAEWEARQSFAEEQLDARMRQGEQIQEYNNDRRAQQQAADQELARRDQIADIEGKAREVEAARKDLLNDAETRRQLNEILRRIAESDLELEEKAGAIQRLMRNAQLRDDRENALADAKSKVEASYAVGHMSLLLTQEQINLEESLAKLTEERDERIEEAKLRREELRKTAEFKRDIEREQANLANEMERLKAQYDQKNIEDQMKERLENQDKEIEKLKLILAHYETIGRQGVDTERIRQDAESVRRQAELNYRDKYEQRDQQREENRERERYNREKDFADQSERLLNKMWEIQGALRKMEMETEQKRDAGNAEVRKAQASADKQKMDELVKSMEEMTLSIRKAIKRVSQKARQDQNHGQNNGQPVGSYGAANPPQGYQTPGPAPYGYQTPGYSYYGGYQTGVQAPVQPAAGNPTPAQPGFSQPEMNSVRLCPNCSKPIGKYDSKCWSCGIHLG